MHGFGSVTVFDTSNSEGLHAAVSVAPCRYLNHASTCTTALLLFSMGSHGLVG